MTTKEQLADIRRQKDELYDKLDALTEKEYKYSHEDDILEASKAVGKYYKKRDDSMGKTELLHVQTFHRGSFNTDEVDVIGECISQTMFLVGDAFINYWQKSRIEINELLRWWDQISEKEYLEEKREILKDLFKDLGDKM